MLHTDLLRSISDCNKNSCWRPVLFTLDSPDAEAGLKGFLSAGKVHRVVDTFSEQLGDLIRARQPNRLWSAEELRDEVSRRMVGRLPKSLGVWVFYPWSSVLCHLLDKEDFQFLRCARNRYKISPTEQAELAKKTIAIAGLSVGLSAATTLAMEGVGGRFRLADFDTLGVSNLNRLRASVTDLGVNKAVLAARQLFEIDAFLDIEIFPEGVTTDNMNAFLAQPTDLLVEECDDLAMKLRLREEARRRRVPVLMDTSDRGLLDVERFDLEPNRPLLHGLLDGIEADQLAGLPTTEKVPYGLRIPDTSQTIETWPQLASAVALGGSVATDAARRIFLGTFNSSGRFYVDCEQIVADGNDVTIKPTCVPTTNEAWVPST